jgi:hypothetical protein
MGSFAASWDMIDLRTTAETKLTGIGAGARDDAIVRKSRACAVSRSML